MNTNDWVISIFHFDTQKQMFANRSRLRRVSPEKSASRVKTRSLEILVLKPKVPLDGGGCLESLIHVMPSGLPHAAKFRLQLVAAELFQ